MLPVIIKCPHCDEIFEVPAVVYANGIAVCHYCGLEFEIKEPKNAECKTDSQRA